MLPSIRYRHALFAAIVFVAAAGPVWAQSDPPDRVARLNYISGQVSFRPASLEEWGAATINYPLTTGDHLWTERNAAAELHVGSAVIRLAPETAFSFLNLDNDVVQARLAEGTLDLRVREIFEGEIYEVDTPNAAISILSPGIYHIDVDPGGDRTRVTVRSGQTEIDAGGRVFSVFPDQMVEIIGVEDVVYDVGRAPSPDRWELWCRDRDRREDNRLALNYVSHDMIGYEDLDDYGTWSYVPEYGYAWEPTVVAVDWAPYRYGHWSWVRPWGWTWIDEARWGFAPSHYGRWTCYHDRWIWLPGQRHSRPVWAPALVAFVGHQDGKFPFAGGNRPGIGWFPLGPGEFYCPSYHASGRYLRNVNMLNVKMANINVNAINVAQIHYANRDVHGAMTAMPRDMFVAAQSVNRLGLAVPRSVAAQTPVLGHGIAVAPNATSVLGHVPVAAARPPASVMRRAVVARAEPPAAGTRAAPVVGTSRRPRPQDVTGSDGKEPVTARGDAADSRTSSAPARGGVADRPRTDQQNNTYYVIPRAEQSPVWSSSDRPAATARPRDDQSPPDKAPYMTGGRDAVAGQPDPVRSSDTPRAMPREATGNQVPVYAPRNEAPSYQAPRYESPRPQAVPRDDRPAQNSGGFAPREDRSTPSRDVRETPAQEKSAPPREERNAERPASPAPASQPPDKAAERPAPSAPPAPPKSDGGNQSNQGGGKPGGGRGGKQ